MVDYSYYISNFVCRLRCSVIKRKYLPAGFNSFIRDYCRAECLFLTRREAKTGRGRNTMKSKKYIAAILCSLSAVSANIFSQAEVPEVFNRYFRINEHVTEVKNASIRKCVELKITKSSQDTLRILYFNSNGTLQQQFIKQDSNTLINTRTGYLNYFYLYDNTGKVNRRIDSSSSEVKKTVISHDYFGNVASEQVEVKSGVISETSYDYDPMGRLIEASEKNKIEGCRITEQYVYDSYNNLVKRIIKNGCGDGDDKTLTSTFIYKYDKRDKIIEKISILSGTTRTEQFTYDEKGNLMGNYVSTSPNSYIKYVYSNDPSSNIRTVEVTETIDDAVTKSYRVITYDKFGNFLEEIFKGFQQEEIYRLKNVYEYY